MSIEHILLRKQKNSLSLSIIMITMAICLGCNTSKGIYENVRGKHLIVENGNKKLFWFSGIHSNDPKSEMFDDIRQEISNFSPSYVLVEGGSNSNNYDSENEAKLAGESAYASFLAKKLNIPCGNIEPSSADINDHLKRSYSVESILAMYILRQMHQKQRESANVSIDFSGYFLGFIESNIREGLPYVISNSDAISILIDPYVGYHVDQSNWLRVNTFHLVYKKTGLIHDIWQETYNFRNEHVLEILKKLFISYDRIFIVMGFDHAEDLSLELHQLIKNIG